MKKAKIKRGKLIYHMERKFTTSEQEVLDVFFASPTYLFTVREIARLTNLTHPTVSLCLLNLKKAGLVEPDSAHHKNTVFWKAKKESEKYRTHKKINNLQQLYASGLVNKIVEETSPNAIVIFGSYSKGEDVEESDIDIFVVSQEKRIIFKRYEKRLHRKINLTFESNIHVLNKEFLNNIINGVILYGYLEVLK